MADVYLGSDGVASDEIVTTYHLRDGELMTTCWGRTSIADPAAAIFDLHVAAKVSEEMIQHGGDYPGRVFACRSTIQRIKEHFNL
jgi:hypothetical protein